MLKIHVVLFSSSWVMNRLNNLSGWWGLPFEFTSVNSSSPIEMKEWGQNLAVLDDPMIDRWKDTGADLNLFVAPYQPPKSFLGLIYDNRASVRGLCDMNTKCLQVFADEMEHSYVNGVDQGNTFELYANHELAHYFYLSMGLVDRTHEYFYSGQPEKARDEILAKMNVSPTLQTNMLNTFCMAIRDFEGGMDDLNYRNNNPGNCRCSPVGYAPQYGDVKCVNNFAVFPTYEQGWQYLLNLVSQRASLHPNWTIRDFFLNYAPPSDNNPSEIYAQTVANKCGVPITITLKELFN